MRVDGEAAGLVDHMPAVVEIEDGHAAPAAVGIAHAETHFLDRRCRAARQQSRPDRILVFGEARDDRAGLLQPAVACVVDAAAHDRIKRVQVLADVGLAERPAEIVESDVRFDQLVLCDEHLVGAREQAAQQIVAARGQPFLRVGPCRAAEECLLAVFHFVFEEPGQMFQIHVHSRCCDRTIATPAAMHARRESFRFLLARGWRGAAIPSISASESRSVHGMRVDQRCRCSLRRRDGR